MWASDHGSIVFAYNDNRTLNRAYDASVLARIWFKLGPEKFRERYKFDWTPSEEMQAKIRAERAGGAGK